MDIFWNNTIGSSQSRSCYRFSELLVGAPFFSDYSDPGQGRVYLYENKGAGNMKLSHQLPITFNKDKWRANFGRAIAAVGDVDLDGFQGMVHKDKILHFNSKMHSIFLFSHIEFISR